VKETITGDELMAFVNADKKQLPEAETAGTIDTTEETEAMETADAAPVTDSEE